MPTLPDTAVQLADRARELAAKVNPGPKAAVRSLPIRGRVSEVEELWAAHRAEILAGIPVTTSSLNAGADQGTWGTTFTLHLELDAPLPGVATQTLAGKAIRRLKALAETGEMPTTAHNPAYRRQATS